MADVSYLRPTVSSRSQNRGYGRGIGAAPRRGGPRRFIIGAFVVILVVVGAGVAILLSTTASLSGDPTALAAVNLPIEGGHVSSITVWGGRSQQPIPVTIKGHQIWPQALVPAGEQVTIQVVVKRPGWVSWLTGSTQRLTMTTTTPVAHLTSHFLTVGTGQPLKLQFVAPVSVFASGAQQGQLHRQVLPTPQSAVTLDRTGSAGSIWVAAAPRSWEKSSTALVTWFPAGAKAAAVMTPSPGSTIGSLTPITVTLSKPVAQVLGSSHPSISPNTPGNWTQTSSHTLVFHPSGYGYGLGTQVSLGLPAGIEIASAGGDPSTASWKVPPGSTLRLQQLLAQLGYLPVQFSPSTPVASTQAAQEAAAVAPPKGTFTWRWSNVPSALRNMWAPGTAGVMTEGAIMSFENNQGMTADGQPSAAVWQALMNAAISGKGASSFGYTFVQVSEGSPETEQTWHSGKTVVQGLVNTGIPATPTAQGVFPVFEHALSVTMEGTNADGSHYDDPGVPYVSYFNGGDALHGFIRASYGYPQSDGCVEMPYSEASSVYPYTPIGTLVDVT